MWNWRPSEVRRLAAQAEVAADDMAHYDGSLMSSLAVLRTTMHCLMLSCRNVGGALTENWKARQVMRR